MNNPIVLLKVERVISKLNGVINYYEIKFDNKYNLAATSLHAFNVIRNGETIYLPTHMLKPNDLIWVDVHAFRADGSYRHQTRLKRRQSGGI